MPLTEDLAERWSQVDDGPLVTRAHSLVRLIAERTATTDQLTDLALRAADQASLPMGWHPPSLSNGQAGVALMHLYAARAGIGDSSVAFDHIREAVMATQVEPLAQPGLFGGTAGLALALADCVRDEPRFGPSLSRLYDQLAAQVLATAFPRVEREVSDSDYDMISGASGILAVLGRVAEPSAQVEAAIVRLLDYLIWLGGPAETEGTARRWLLVPAVYPPVGNYHRDHPHGYLNVGLSHGVPGIMAALAAAWAAGYHRPGHREALEAMTAWVTSHQLSDDHGPLWPNGISVDEDGAELRRTQRHDQLAWCYGTAGVCAAVLSVADATADDGLRKLAVTAFDGVLGRVAATRPLSPTLCHGQAGLLMLCAEFAPHSSLAARSLPVLLEKVLDYADPRLPVVFADQDVPGNLVDDAGLLTGAAGVALALLAATGDQRPHWFSAFLGR